MIKRDRFSEFISWATRLLGLLLLVLCFIGGWTVFSTSSSLDLGGKIQAFVKLVVVFSVVVPFIVKLLDPEIWKQWRRVEFLRRNHDQATFYATPPREINEVRNSLPITLGFRISLGGWGCITALLLALIPGIIPGSLYLAVKTPIMDSGTIIILGIFFVFLGGFFGMLGLLRYQRIEATQEGLLIQRGLKRRTIPWEQATLFASVKLKGLPDQYELSSASTCLRWEAHYPQGVFIASSPKTRQEYEQQLLNLLSVIRSRTGLPLMDLH